MRNDTVQILECPHCHFRLEAPLVYVEACCPNRHIDARKRPFRALLKVVWDRAEMSA